MILYNQNMERFEATSYGQDGCDVYCTTDKAKEERHVLATYNSPERASEVVNVISASGKEELVLPRPY